MVSSDLSGNTVLYSTLRTADTISTWVRHHSSERPDSVAIVCGDQEISYGELWETVNATAAGLVSEGIGPGDIVAIQLPNSVEFLVAYLAICRIGAIVQMLHMPYRQRELRYLLTDSGARAAICLGEFKDYKPSEWFREIRDTELKELSIIVVGNPDHDMCSFSELLTSNEPLLVDPPTADTNFVLLYTSGTTSDPKGVMHRYEGFLGNAAVAASELEFGTHSRTLCLAAYTHLYGLFTVNLSLSVGATLVVMPAFDPDIFQKFLSDHKPTAIFAAPAHFAGAIESGELRKEVFESAELVCLSGSAVPEPLAREIEDLLDDGVVIQLWGMTELQAGSYGRPSDSPDLRLTSAGKPSPGTEFRVVNDDNRPVSTGEEGHLQVRGPSVFEEYLNKPDETQLAFEDDGWFLTGDLAVLGNDEALKITGRAKEIINRGGVKYNPLEVEEVLSGYVEIAQCAIAPVRDQVLGEIACIYVVTAAGTEVTLEKVCDYLANSGIAKYKWPERLKVINEMPMTPTNKVARARLESATIDKSECG